MDDIKEIIARIVKACGQAGYEVPEILAAFVARTVVETNASTFALDKKVTPEKVEEVIVQSVSRLLEKDNPSLEMMKMQVDYDSTYLKEDTEMQKKLKTRNKMIASHKMAVVEVEMADANDYESLTTLYRKIFKFLLDFAPNSKSSDRSIEREVAAALESVFPRVGLKAFISLSYDEKIAQLLELARIILGIRLFNKSENRGGAGIDNMEKDGHILATILSADIDREVMFFTDACQKYQKAIIKAHNNKRKKAFEEEKYELDRINFENDPDHHEDPAIAREKALKAQAENKFNSLQPVEANDFMIDRWSQELANRHQYLCLLKLLQDETKFLKEKIGSICEKIRLELQNIKNLVSNKASVPKEVVYPRFDSLGTLWIQLYEEVIVMIARSNTFQTLCKYRLSFQPTLSESYYLDEKHQTDVSLHPDLTRADSKGVVAEGKSGKSVRIDDDKAYDDKDGDAYADAKADAKDSGDAKGSGEPAEGFYPEGQDPSNAAGVNFDETYPSGARLLSVQNTPDFMLLPLELQGYCPWTIVEARGLLIPGRPVLGIIRYENLYYVCDHVMAIRAFLLNPEHYLQQLKERAMKNPEYIHLLRLQRWFPSQSIARLLKLHDMEAQNKSGLPLTRDASTGTPTHFVESYIDINYHWNEWELRRRALKIVNLKNCATQSQQTDQSHFRRDNETQVYLPKDGNTQTKRDKGTNPPIVTTYVTGLRGKQLIADETSKKQYVDAKSSINADALKPKNIGYPKCGVVTLKLDLQK